MSEDSDTIYNIGRSANSETARSIREAAAGLQKITPEERQKISKSKRVMIRKATAKTLLAGIENIDTIFGLLERICLLILADMLKRGNFLIFFLFLISMLVAWFLKIRMDQGPLIKMFRAGPNHIKTKLIDATRTIYSE